jgi:hypothetical protein
MDIKPRNTTGLIFALVDQKRPENGDFVVLELNDGSVSSLENYYHSLRKFWTIPVCCNGMPIYRTVPCSKAHDVPL